MSVLRGLAGRCIRPDGSVRHQQDRATGAAAWAAVPRYRGVPELALVASAGAVHKRQRRECKSLREKNKHTGLIRQPKKTQKECLCFFFFMFFCLGMRARAQSWQPPCPARRWRGPLVPCWCSPAFSCVLLSSLAFSRVLSRSAQFCSVLPAPTTLPRAVGGPIRVRCR